MKSRERIHWYLRFWAISLAVALILLGQFLIADAQTTKSKITVTGANDIFEQTLAQPAKFLQTLEITPEQVQKQLKARPRIAVVGAGFVRNLGATPLPGIQNARQAKSSIQVEGAGAARVIGLTAFAGISSSPSKPGIDVAGAGSVRNVGLVAPVVQ